MQICADTTAPGSLRYIAVNANSGDTIDFSGLPAACGMTDSTITLSAGEIILHQQQITLVGPAPGSGTVTLSGGGNTRVLRHQVYAPFTGTLRIANLRIANGYASASASIGGGCVYSDANIDLTESVVEGCTAHSSTANAYGGGLHAPNGRISVVSSRVSGNTVSGGPNGNAFGGGTSSANLFAKYSEISGNNALGLFASGGGGAAATMNIGYSTIVSNHSEGLGGGVSTTFGTQDSLITDSTFSGNHSHYMGGAIFASADHFYLSNSTVASNSTDYQHSAGVYFKGAAADVESTIIANNASAAMANGADLYIKSGMLTGAANAVMSSNVSPSGVIVSIADPKLAPLAWIGGPTRTMDLRSGSPAIGLGNNVGGRISDQRGLGFPRGTGPSMSVDIGAVQGSDRIFFSNLDGFFL